MKLILSILFGIFISLSSFASDTISVQSKINKVTVFLKGAQISRTAKITIPKGSKTIKMKGLSANLQPKSIQVSAGNDLTILSVSFQTNYSEKHKDEKKTKLLLKKKLLLFDNIGIECRLFNLFL